MIRFQKVVAFFLDLGRMTEIFANRVVHPHSSSEDIKIRRSDVSGYGSRISETNKTKALTQMKESNIIKGSHGLESTGVGWVGI